MSESEMAKNVTRLIKALDKLVQDVLDGVLKLREAARDLKREKQKDEEEKGE